MRFLSLVLVAAVLPCRAENVTFASAIGPVLERNCTKCHGPTKQKAGLRLDTHAAVILGSKEGAVVNPGDPEGSELIRRISLPPGDEDLMPSGEQPLLAPQEVVALKAWVAAGAPATEAFEPVYVDRAVVVPPAAPDYRPRLGQAISLAHSLGVTLVPRSRVPTDGLVLRTAGAPSRCDDTVLSRLAPVSDLIVEAELARTQVSDQGMASVGAWTNLERLDLTRTRVSSDGVALLSPLKRLDTLNLTETRVDSRGLALAAQFHSVRRLWAFQGP